MPYCMSLLDHVLQSTEIHCTSFYLFPLLVSPNSFPRVCRIISLFPSLTIFSFVLSFYFIQYCSSVFERPHDKYGWPQRLSDGLFFSVDHDILLFNWVLDSRCFVTVLLDGSRLEVYIDRYCDDGDNCCRCSSQILIVFRQSMSNESVMRSYWRRTSLHAMFWRAKLWVRTQWRRTVLHEFICNSPPADVALML